MNKLTYSQSVVVIIFGAIGAVLFGYAVWRLFASRKEWEKEPLKEMSPEQKEYLVFVRDRNRQHMAASIGLRL